MSKARSTGNLNNSIVISDTGAITFVSGSTTLATLNTTGQLSGSAPVVFAATSSFANAFTVAGTLTAQTLVVQTVTSSIVYSSGSNIFGNNIANTQVLTGSVTVTGSLAVVTNGTELQVGATGVTLGNTLTDIHNITGSVLVTGSITSQGGFILGNSATISPTGSIGYNNAIGVFIYGKSGSEADFRLYNRNGLTAMSVVAGTQNVSFNGSVGIGTSSPSFLLDLQRSSAGADVALRIQNTAASGVNDASALHLGWSSTLTGYSSIITDRGGRAGSSSAQGSLYFNANQDTTERIRMIIRGDTGNVGIGTTGPSHTLTVAGNVGMSRFYSTVAFSSYTPDGLFNAASRYCTVTPPGSGELRFGYLDYGAGQYWGRIGFVATTNWSLGTVGSAGNDFSIGTGYAGSQLYIYSNGNYAFSGSNVSDRRKKTNINYITTNQLDNILKLKPATFNKIADEVVNENVHTGFIAQDIMEVGIPNLVMGSDEGGYGLDYDGVLALAVKAIQELKAENDTLKEILQRNNIQ